MLCGNSAQSPPCAKRGRFVLGQRRPSEARPNRGLRRSIQIVHDLLRTPCTVGILDHDDDLLAFLARVIAERLFHAGRDNGKAAPAFERPIGLREVLEVGQVGLNEFAQAFDAGEAWMVGRN